MIEERAAAASGYPIVRRYVHGPSGDEPLVWYEGSGTSDRRWLHADERGSIVAISDGSGTGLFANRYDEDGNVQGPDGAGALVGRFGYAGQPWIPELGLSYNRARFYNPALPGFMQPDPIGWAAGPNDYDYVGGDPVNFTDPSGLAGEACSGTLIASACGDDEHKGRVLKHGAGDSGGGGLVGGPLAGGTCKGCIGASDPRVDRSIAYWGGFYSNGVWISTTASTFRGHGATGSWDSFTAGSSIGYGGGGAHASWEPHPDCGCLEAGTLVSTPSGLVPIEEIEVNDLVLSFNELTGEIAQKRVTALIRPEARPLFALSLLNDTGEAETFYATDDHPWKVEGRGWVETSDINTGDRIDSPGANLTVTSVVRTERNEHTYNLTVEDWHTFLVGQSQAVVHNAKPCWKRTPATLQERMAVDAAKRGAGTLIMEGLDDPQFRGMEKWQYVVKSDRGLITTVHYVRDPATGSLMDFKLMTTGKTK